MTFIRKNLANAISLFRIFLLPPLVYYAVIGEQYLFFYLGLFLIFTDFLDGAVARLLKTESEFGRMLDVTMDQVFFPVFIVGSLYIFEIYTRVPYWYIGMFMIHPVIPRIIAYLAYRRLPEWHLWSRRITTYIFTLFVIINLFIGVQLWMFHLLFVSNMLGTIEELLLLFRDKGVYRNEVTSYFQR